MKIHITYLQASLILGKTAKCAFFLCDGDNMSLFIPRKTLQTFIAIFPVQQNIEGLEKRQYFSSFKYWTCHTLQLLSCVLLLAEELTGWQKIVSQSCSQIRKKCHAMNSTPKSNEENIRYRQIDMKYIWNQENVNNAGKVPITNQRIHAFLQSPICWNLQVFIAFSAKHTFRSWPVGRKFFEGKHNRYKSVIV